MNLVTPTALAKHELLFNKPATEVGLLNKSSCLATASGVTKRISVIAMNVAKLCGAYKIFYKGSFLAFFCPPVKDGTRTLDLDMTRRVFHHCATLGFSTKARS
jgi:hypothetical protein